MPIITAPIHMTATTIANGMETKVGEWTPTKRFVQDPQYKMEKIKRFFRVGRGQSIDSHRMESSRVKKLRQKIKLTHRLLPLSQTSSGLVGQCTPQYSNHSTFAFQKM